MKFFIIFLLLNLAKFQDEEFNEQPIIIPENLQNQEVHENFNEQENQIQNEEENQEENQQEEEEEIIEPEEGQEELIPTENPEYEQQLQQEQEEKQLELTEYLKFMQERFEKQQDYFMGCLEKIPEKTFDKTDVLQCTGSHFYKIHDSFNYVENQIKYKILEGISQQKENECVQLYEDKSKTQGAVYKKLPYLEKVSVVQKQCDQILKDGIDIIFLGMNVGAVLSKNSFFYTSSDVGLPRENYDKLISVFEEKQEMINKVVKELNSNKTIYKIKIEDFIHKRTQNIKKQIEYLKKNPPVKKIHTVIKTRQFVKGFDNNQKFNKDLLPIKIPLNGDKKLYDWDPIYRKNLEDWKVTNEGTSILDKANLIINIPQLF